MIGYAFSFGLMGLGALCVAYYAGKLVEHNYWCREFGWTEDEEDWTDADGYEDYACDVDSAIRNADSGGGMGQAARSEKMGKIISFR